MTDEHDMTREEWSPAPAVAAESPALFTAMVGSLADKRRELARALDQGLPPDAFRRGQALLSAYDAAVAGLTRARQRKTGTPTENEHGL